MAQEILKDKSNRCVYATIGASSHSDEDRMINDYYATDPNALERLLKFEVFHEKVWEHLRAMCIINDRRYKGDYDIIVETEIKGREDAQTRMRSIHLCMKDLRELVKTL